MPRRIFVFMDLPKLALQQWPLLLFILLCIVAGIQLFYYLFFFARLAWYKAPVSHQSQTHAVSVILCARDEAANLAKNLPGILVQQYPSTHEVVVVNDNSYDESRYLLEELKKEFKQMHVVELTQEAKMIPGKKFPLSIGIKTARHEILLLTDADCVPASENWIGSMQAAYQPNTEIVLGYGPMHKKKGLLNKLIRWETFHTALQYMSYALAGMPYMGVGRNLSYKKNLFFKLKGFSAHNHVPGGDDDLFINAAGNKHNTAINIHPDSFTLSEPPASWQQWRRQKQRHYTTSKHYKGLHKFLLALYAIAHFLFYPLLITVALFYNWKIALILLGCRWLLLGVLYYKTMRKLNEADLFPLYILLDLWMSLYYFIFAPALFKKPRPTWK